MSTRSLGQRRARLLMPFGLVAAVLSVASLAYACTIMNGVTTITSIGCTPGAPAPYTAVCQHNTVVGGTAPLVGLPLMNFTASATGLYTDATIGGTQPYYLKEATLDPCHPGAEIVNVGGAGLPSPTGYTGTPNKNGSYTDVQGAFSSVYPYGSVLICFATGSNSSDPAAVFIV